MEERMMSKKWKITALLLACIMAMTACGQVGESKNTNTSASSESKQSASSSISQEESKYFNETGFPIVNEEITLKILCCANAASTVDFEDMPGWKYLSELMGINFEIESYAEKDLYNKMPLIMSDPESMPDIFLQCGMGGTDLLNYGQQGLLLDLTDLIEQYGTNIKKSWETEALNRSYATSTDGSIYGLPSYNNYGVPSGVWTFQVNKRWMENCGITEYPDTVEEFKNMLIAFRDMDANGNGDPNDEIPLMGNQTSIFQILGAAFNMPIDWPWVGVQYGALYGTTEAVPVFMLDNYRSMVEFINELYEEKLINQDMFSVAGDENKARRLSDIYGVNANLTDYNVAEKYNPDEWVSIPLMGSEYVEDPTAYAYVTPQYQTGMGMISSNTKYPEACIRFLDYLMSADGTALFVNAHLTSLYTGGYDLEAAGVSKEIIDMYSKELENNGGNVSLAKANIVGCGGCLWLYQFADYAIEQTNMNTMAKTSTELKKSYSGKEFFNPTHTISLTEEEQEIVSTYKTDIDSYVKETVAKWIAGEEDLNDETWKTYIEKIEAMHVDKLTDAYVGAHNRFFGVE